MKLPGWVALLGKMALFVTGLGIVVTQTGFLWLIEAPKDGPSIPALICDALFCNGPGVLQALSIRFGTSSSGAPSQPSSQPSSSPSSSGVE